MPSGRNVGANYKLRRVRLHAESQNGVHRGASVCQEAVQESATEAELRSVKGQILLGQLVQLRRQSHPRFQVSFQFHTGDQAA